MTDPEPQPRVLASVSRTRSREIATAVTLSLICAGIFFLLLELTLRIAELAPTHILSYPDQETWSRFPGPFEPGQDFVSRVRPRLAYRVRVNSLGFRGPDFDLLKPAGVYRILCVGNSRTFGDYVDEEDTFPAQLEKRLRQESGRSVEVINAGVIGYTITDESDFLREKGFALQPDAIIVGFALNDLAGLTGRTPSRENQRNRARELSEFRLTPLRRTLRQTATYNLLAMVKASIVGRLGLDPALQDARIHRLLHPPYDERTEALFGRYRTVLASVEEDCKAKGIRLTLVLFPFYEQVAEGASVEAQARITKMASDLGVDVVDLLGSFRKAGARAGKLFLVPLDHQPSARGYRLAAASVGRAIAGSMP